jgi:hypothetical protein
MGEPNNITIVLTKSALERLFGDDPELQVEIRHAAAKVLLEQHMETAMRTKAVSEVEGRITKAVHQIIDDRVGTNIGSSYRPNIQLTDETKAAANSYINHEFGTVIHDLVNKAVDELNIEGLIAGKVEAAVVFRIRQGITQRLKQITQEVNDEAGG